MVFKPLEKLKLLKQNIFYLQNSTTVQSKSFKERIEQKFEICSKLFLYFIPIRVTSNFKDDLDRSIGLACILNFRQVGGKDDDGDGDDLQKRKIYFLLGFRSSARLFRAIFNFFSTLFLYSCV